VAAPRWSKRLFASGLGVAVRRLRNVPFGVDWVEDAAHYLGPGARVFVDVGANEGQTALRLLARYPGAEVHSFEPVPETFERMRRRLAGTGVRAVQSAVGDRVGRATLFLGDGSEHSGFDAGGEEVEVDVTTLDEYAARALRAPIDLLKVDVEGHEAAVLAGASGLLEAGRVRLVVCECDFERRPSEPHASFDDVFGFLRPLGFRVVAFYCGGVDELGWRWGDVLLRHVSADEGRQCVAVSPFRGGARPAGEPPAALEEPPALQGAIR
jgi:FkbM family methyltransferase